MANDRLDITTDFPGANIIVERADGDDVFIRQDQRGSTERWFYWHFAVCGAAGRTLRFHFTDWDVIGQCGPAISIDGGRTWRWLGRDCVEGVSFAHTFGPEEYETRFCFCIPYTHGDLEAFLADRPDIDRQLLCTTATGRPVERLIAGQPDAGRCLLLTARHHCCEAAANFVLEGLLDRCRARPIDDVAIAAVPFMDADGVEAGDQGKTRDGHDHNRDYVGPGRYAETRALRRWFPNWQAARPAAVIDLHCPWIRGGWNERVYMVGQRWPHIIPEQRRFIASLAKVSRGPLTVEGDDFLPFGQDWNVGREPLTEKKTCTNWAAEQIDVRLAGTMEVPYAAVRGAEVTVDRLRSLGEDFAEALRLWFAELR